MALTERTRPYETLIRHNSDGTVGSHHVTITEVLRDGVVINATIEPPQSLDGAGLEGVIGSAFVQATAQITSMQAEVTEANAARDEAQGKNAADASAIADLTAQVASLQTIIAAHSAANSVAEAPAPDAEADPAPTE